MSIGRSGVKGLTFINSEDSLDSTKSTKKLEDEISVLDIDELAKNDDHIDRHLLYRGDKLTNRGVILMIALSNTIFAGCTSYALIAPFFPRVAEQKGLTISQYSLVFTIYEIMCFVLPPFCSKVAMRITPKILLMTSLFIIAFCSTMFGFLIYSKAENFFYLCLIVRVAWSVGGAGCATAAYTCGTLLFPNHISQIYSVIEIGAGFGFMCGPAIGGYLFEKGGFPLPFVVTAGFSILSIIPIWLLVKNELKRKDENEQNQNSATFLQTFRLPGVTVNLLLSSVTCFCIGFNESTLDYHLREIGNFTPSSVGQVFLITGLVYSIFTYGFGLAAKRWSNCYYLIYIGLVSIACSFAVVGPLPFIPLSPALSYVIISQVCFGIGSGAIFVLSFDDCVKQAKMYLPNNDSTMASISGFYTSSYALGTSIGPFVGGQLVERWGYRAATTPMTFCMLFLIVLVSVYIFILKKDAKSSHRDSS